MPETWDLLENQKIPIVPRVKDTYCRSRPCGNDRFRTHACKRGLAGVVKFTVIPVKTGIHISLERDSFLNLATCGFRHPPE